jgi:LysM repeat protein
MTHDHDSDERKTRNLPDSQQFGWHPDAPTPTDFEQLQADLTSNDATPVSFTGPSLLGDAPAESPAYWTPGQPGELPPTIIRRNAPPSAQELLAKYSKPAMMALTVAAVSSAGMAQNTQNTLAQANNSTDSGDSPNVQAADTEQQPQLYQLLNDTSEDVRATASGNGADRTQPFIYTVERGDWVRHIARDFGLQTMTVVWNNDLPNPDFILPGQELLILPVDGIMIEVQPGDTLNSIATHYGVSATAIINFEPNGITNPDMIQPGQVMIVPGGVPPESGSVPTATSQTGTQASGEPVAATQESASASQPVQENASEPEPVQASSPEPQAESEPVEEQSAGYNGIGDSVIVEPGDTLAEIASLHGVSVEVLVSLNGLGDADVIQPGDELYLPEGVEAQTPPAPEPQPDPEPEPEPDEPEPQQAPEPTPVPQPDPAPAPEPEPEPTPEPAPPQPEPTATPQPAPTATPAPAPTATPEPEPTPAPEPPQSSGPPSGIEAQLEYYANQYGVDPNLIKAVAWRESGWNQSAISSAGAIGVMQVMPGTATWINNNLVSRNLDVRGSTADNIEAGTAYLAHRIDQFGDVERGLAAYFMGPATVQNYGITATGRQYVDRIFEIRDYIAANGSPPSWR